MRVGIVGSRSFPQLQLIEWFIRDLPDGVTIVSGGAKGVDLCAQHYAERRGLATDIYLPRLDDCKLRIDFTKRYYERNQKIVDNIDLLIAFTEKENGGTWDTIKKALKSNKPIKIIKPSVFFPAEKQDDASQIDINNVVENKQRRGPFSVRGISLGSYALRKKKYIDSLEWGKIIVMKDNNPHQLADYMMKDFLIFFEKNKKFGAIHAITVPPRSIRNLNKAHVMDILTQNLAKTLDIDWVRMFEPWDKNRRGRFATHGEIKITPDASKYISKVVWICDDVTTTNYTLKCAVQSLMQLEIHAHGLAYITMS
jgi:hypothetical protein